MPRVPLEDKEAHSQPWAVGAMILLAVTGGGGGGGCDPFLPDKSEPSAEREEPGPQCPLEGCGQRQRRPHECGPAGATVLTEQGHSQTQGPRAKLDLGNEAFLSSLPRARLAPSLLLSRRAWWLRHLIQPSGLLLINRGQHSSPRH